MILVNITIGDPKTGILSKEQMQYITLESVTAGMPTLVNRLLKQGRIIYRNSFLADGMLQTSTLFVSEECYLNEFKNVPSHVRLREYLTVAGFEITEATQNL